MAKYIVLFEDNVEFADQRTNFMSEHLKFLARNADWLEAERPLFDSSDGNSAGGLWLVDADTPEKVMSLTHEDPFWPTGLGLRKSVRILNWKQVFNKSSRTTLL